jgi:hypothetical protein
LAAVVHGESCIIWYHRAPFVTHIVTHQAPAHLQLKRLLLFRFTMQAVPHIIPFGRDFVARVRPIVIDAGDELLRQGQLFVEDLRAQ